MIELWLSSKVLRQWIARAWTPSSQGKPSCLFLIRFTSWSPSSSSSLLVSLASSLSPHQHHHYHRPGASINFTFWQQMCRKWSVRITNQVWLHAWIPSIVSHFGLIWKVLTTIKDCHQSTKRVKFHSHRNTITTGNQLYFKITVWRLWLNHRLNPYPWTSKFTQVICI